MADVDGILAVEVAVSDPAEFRPLREWLTRVPAVEVEQRASTPGPGEQGAADVLRILAGSDSVLAVAIRSLPDFIRSRRSDVTVTVRAADGKEITLTASNVDDAAVIVRLLHG